MKGAGVARLPAALILGVMLLSAPGVAAENPPVVTLFEHTDKPPRISRDRAITRAVNATGLKLTPTKVEYGLATDTAIPFFNVLKRPAWKITFDGVQIFGKNEKGVREKNPNIGSITVLIDAETGALLKVSSPKPPAGGLPEGPNRVGPSGSMEVGGFVLKSTSLMPKVGFAQALSAADSMLTIALEAKELVAYFGLMTDTVRTDRNVVDRPFWIIFAGGLSLPSLSGSLPPGTNAFILVDADSGTPYGAAFGS